MTELPDKKVRTMAKKKAGKIIDIKPINNDVQPRPAAHGMITHFGTFKKVRKNMFQILGNVNDIYIPPNKSPNKPISGVLLEGDSFGSVTTSDKFVCLSRVDISRTFTITNERRTKKEKQTLLKQFKKFVHL